MINLLHTNQRLLVLELQKRGAICDIIDLQDELLQVTYKDKKDFILDRFSSVVPFHVTKITADKHLAKSILYKNNIQIPCGGVFTCQRLKECLEYASSMYPLVLKPNWGSHGDHIRVNIQNEKELVEAIDKFAKDCGVHTAFILEKFYPWKEYRLFITSQGGFAVIHRQPASVIGNGVNTIEQLANMESKNRIALKSFTPTSLCPLVLDEEVKVCLHKQELNLQSILKKDEQVFLRQQSNLAKGGVSIDMTDNVHPDVKLLAARALKCFPGLPCAGLDLLCEDISKPLNESNHAIIEINSSPGLAMHTYPHMGQSRNVASLLADVMFPDFFL